MMKRLICMALATLVSQAAMGADLAVPRLNGSVKYDGRLDEAMWRTAARLPHTALLRWIDDTYVKDPTAFHLRFFHDGRTLYVALVSRDRDVEADALPENSDGLYSLSFLTRDGELKHYRLRWSANPPVAGGDMLDSGKWGARLRGPFGDPARRGDGYVFEIAIRLADLGWKAGDTVPLNIIVNDRDGEPGASYHAQGAEFARYAWGSFDNEDRAAYKTLKLAP